MVVWALWKASSIIASGKSSLYARLSSDLLLNAPEHVALIQDSYMIHN